MTDEALKYIEEDDIQGFVNLIQRGQWGTVKSNLDVEQDEAKFQYGRVLMMNILCRRKPKREGQ
jgi:hypothetical protein